LSRGGEIGRRKFVVVMGMRERKRRIRRGKAFREVAFLVEEEGGERERTRSPAY